MQNLKEVKIKVNLQNPEQVMVVPVIIDFTGRKNLKNVKSWEDGEYHFYNTWEREDGKVDTYVEILKEGISNGYNH